MQGATVKEQYTQGTKSVILCPYLTTSPTELSETYFQRTVSVCLLPRLSKCGLVILIQILIKQWRTHMKSKQQCNHETTLLKAQGLCSFPQVV